MYIKKYLEFLLEKSSLNKFHLDQRLIREIQIDYEIKDNATWSDELNKSTMEEILKQNESNLFLCLDTRKDEVMVCMSLLIRGHKLYTIDQFVLDEEADWGGDWEKRERLVVSLTELLNQVSGKYHKVYQLMDRYFKAEPKVVRRIKGAETHYEEFHNEFKAEFLSKLNVIIRMIYKNKSNQIAKEMIDNLDFITNNMLDNSEKDRIKKIINFGVDPKQKAEFMSLAKTDDYKFLKSVVERPNGLNALDQYLMEFEEAYRESYGYKDLSLEEMCDMWGRDKIMTALLHYVHTGKVYKLKYSKYDS